MTDKPKVWALDREAEKNALATQRWYWKGPEEQRAGAERAIAMTLFEEPDDDV